MSIRIVGPDGEFGQGWDAAAKQDADEFKRLDARIAELEAALGEAELLLTGLAMSPARVAVCPDSKLTATLVRVREALQKSTR